MEATQVPHHEFMFVSQGYTKYILEAAFQTICVYLQILCSFHNILDFILFCEFFSSPTLSFFLFTFKAKLKY